MGKTEKIVVLSILFLVVVLFVWSLGGGDGASAKGREGDTESASYSGVTAAPAGGAPAALPEGRMLSRPGAGGARPQDNGAASAPEGRGQAIQQDTDRVTLQPPAERTSRPLDEADVEGRVLFAGVDRGRSGAAEERRPSVQMRPGWSIVTTVGLEATVDPNMLLYRPAAEDTWDSVALSLYGDEDKAALLRHNNEGMEEPRGVIFVPAKDDGAEDVGLLEIVVLQGESLWDVSKRTLGEGSRWREIYKANLDVISDPDFVAPNTVLKVMVK